MSNEFINKLFSNSEMEQIIKEHLQKIFDPELPVNIYDLGLIYDIKCKEDTNSSIKICHITMTLTSATCSFSEVIVDLVKNISSIQEGLKEVKVSIVFDPPWSQDSMSDDAKLAMGLL